MLVTQLYDLVNTVTKEVLGETVIVNEDLGNVVDIGTAIFNSNQVDNYVKKLVDHIGKVVFVNRTYSGGAPSVLMDAWEFGSVLEKVSTDLPNASENSSWSLTDGQTYEQDIFKSPKVVTKFFNSKVTFEIQMSFAETQLKSAFSSPEQLNGFISMIHTSVENSLTVKLDGLIMRAINNMVGETYINSSASVNSINLLEGFNTSTGGSLTAAKCLYDPAFIRYAIYTISLFSDRLTKISTLFNAENKPRFTPKDLQRIILLSDFSKASETYLLSDVHSPEKLTLPHHDSIPYWQGSGIDYAFESTSSINIKTASGQVVELGGILGVISDRDAVAVANLDRRTTVAYNARGEFFNNWFKADAQYINDLSENFVVFYVKDAAP